jgi:hypothetical protein
VTRTDPARTAVALPQPTTQETMPGVRARLELGRDL